MKDYSKSIKEFLEEHYKIVPRDDGEYIRTNIIGLEIFKNYLLWLKAKNMPSINHQYFYKSVRRIREVAVIRIKGKARIAGIKEIKYSDIEKEMPE